MSLPTLSPSQHAIIAEEVRKQHIPGLSVAMVSDGKVISAEAFGWRNVERQLPMTVNTITPIASLTKSMTAVAIMRLTEEGKLSLDEPVSAYLPDFRLADAEATRRVTLRMLLAHTSGLGATGHQDRVFKEDSPPYPDRAALVARLVETSPQTPPGTFFSYSNEGYAVLGLLVDRLSGMSAEAYLQTHLFDPLEMRDTCMRFTDWRAADDRAWGYTHSEDGFTPSVMPKDYTAYAAGGGVCSSAIDMARYLIATMDYDNSPLLAGGSLDQMHSVSAAFGDTGWGYGFGWSLGWSAGRKVIEHSGGHPGHTTYLLALPWQKLGMVILSNGAVEDIGWLAERLMSDLLGAPLYRTESTQPLPFRTRYPQPDSETLATYTGMYTDKDGGMGSIVVSVVDGELTLTRRRPDFPDQWFTTLALGQDRFLTRRWASYETFLRNDRQEVTGMLGNGVYFAKS